MSIQYTKSMTTSYWLKTATQFLQSKGIVTARLDAIILLEDVLRVNRATILAEPELEIKDGAVAALQKLLIRRATHEPLAYIRGKTEFYGRMFKVSHAVLVPRPESEAMIELLKTLVDQPNFPTQPKIADIGAGSGNLGITAALELPQSQVTLLEIDESALETLKLNVVLHATRVTAIKSDLLLSAADNFDILLCNLPYVPDEYDINLAASHEPKLALFAGQDGLDLYRQLFAQILSLEKKPLYILTEALPSQHHELATLASHNCYELTKTDDFIQLYTYKN
jgi:release factor glutamine methyltransferase